MLEKALHGNEKLWMVFWVYYVTVGLFFSIFYVPLLVILFSHIGLVIIVGSVVWLGWLWLSAVLIWRNSGNTSFKLFGYAAKGVFILWPVVGISYETWRVLST